MADILVMLKTTEGDNYSLDGITSFTFKKDKYTPYTRLSLSVQDYGGIIPKNAVFNRVSFFIDHSMVHDGLIDSSDYRTQKGASVLNISSRSFTSLLLDNQMIPGIHSNMTLERLMTEYYDLPVQIKWENDASVCSYIYVKEHRSMWDSVVNLGYKLYGTYPYIRSANTIYLKPHSGAYTRKFMKREMLAFGTSVNTQGIISDFHMQDIEGNYDTYNLTNPDADELYIVRHKQIPFDRQYLDDPSESMRLSFNLTSKAWKKRYITVSGYYPLDINDYTGAEGFFETERICGVAVSGNSKGIQSTYFVYDDNFHSL